MSVESMHTSNIAIWSTELNSVWVFFYCHVTVAYYLAKSKLFKNAAIKSCVPFLVVYGMHPSCHQVPVHQNGKRSRIKSSRNTHLCIYLTFKIQVRLLSTPF